MAPKQIGVLDHGAFQWLEDNALFAQVFREDVAFQEMIVGKNEAPGRLIEAAGTLEDLATLIVGERLGREVGGKIESPNAGEAPGLISARRHGQAVELRPRRALLLSEPSGQRVVAAGLDAVKDCGFFWHSGGDFFENG
ncbi:MAG: hypothetical protein M3Q46_13320 [Verrucomicrobiota bacterium]|nr:hypothetical protein [Verrucomicrobiota bacterium]